LFLGTDLDNARDRDQKGRRVDMRGEACGNAILTEDEVLAIRSSPEIGTVLAVKLGVSQQTISAIRTRESWRHI
jgi:hypothetical protein